MFRPPSKPYSHRRLTGSSRRDRFENCGFQCEAQRRLIDSSQKILQRRCAAKYHPRHSHIQFMTQLRPTNGAPLGGLTRAMLLAWAVFLLSGFTVARTLKPDPRGYGTHQQFGLPECSIRVLFARPCPGCGMTTSFSYFVRGEFASAARANPAGVLLAMLCVLMIPWSLWSAWQGSMWLVEEPMTLLAILIAVIGCLAVLSWMFAIWRVV